jgi:RNA polymerase-binding transcription factor DksA
MDTARKDHYREVLTALSHRLHGDTDAVSEQALRSAGGQAAGEITNVPQHPGDMGTDEYLHGINMTLLENEEYLTREVREALSRLDDRTFGICEACGKSIREERLEAIPYTRYCTTCAERLEPIFMPNYNSSDAPQVPPSYDASFTNPAAALDESPFPDEDDQDNPPKKAR